MEKHVKVDFSLFISGLFAEGMIALGKIRNPVTQKLDKNPEHASYVIDTLVVLKEKTRGNLTEEESGGLEEGIHQLRMIYVAEQNRPLGEPADQPESESDSSGKEEKQG